MNNNIIVALDGFQTIGDVFGLVNKLDTSITRYKIGLEAFIKFGMPLVENLSVIKGKKVFLDLKMDDIPETITLAVKALALTQNIEFITLRGGRSVVDAARAGLDDALLEYPKLLWVSILSSQSNEYVFPPEMKDAPFDGVITSGKRIIYFRNLFGYHKVIVSPGVRMEVDATDDHSAFTTPSEAIRYGADYLVIGRPITKAADPARKVQEIVDEMNNPNITYGEE